MLKTRSLLRRTGCSIAIKVVVCLVIVVLIFRSVMLHDQWLRDKRSMLFVEKAGPEELLNACRAMMDNYRLLESGHRDVQVDKSYFEMTSSDGPWPEGVPSVIVDLNPRYLKISERFVEVHFGRDANTIFLWAFPSNQVGMGSLRVIDGLWIVSPSSPVGLILKEILSASSTGQAQKP